MLKKVGLWRGLAGLLSAIMVFAVLATLVLVDNAATINSFFSIQTSKNVGEEGPEYYKSTFGELNVENLLKLEDAAYAQTVKEAEEGAVLLKNSNNALPLLPTERKVTLFGMSTVSPLYKTMAAGAKSHVYNPELRVSLDQALKTAGFEINQVLFDAYLAGEMSLGTEKGTAVRREQPLNFYTPAIRASWLNYKQVAVVMLYREGAEGNDMFVKERDVKPGGTGQGDYVSSLSLVQREKDMLQMVKDEGFGKIIVLINTNYQMELGWLDNYNVDACLFIGTPGLKGFTGVVNVLTGATNPSGRLVSTFAANSLSSPAIVNACGNTPKWANASSIRNSGIIKDPTGDTDYVTVQAESIYIGYKYYETRYADAIMNNAGNAKSGAGSFFGSTWDYAKEMCYPFGFGLSYTTFSQTIESVSPKSADNIYTVKVKVENTGAKPGKCSAQLYVNTPYGEYEKSEEHKIEKSAITLVGFGKTGVLPVGGSETLEIKVDEYLFASYDYIGTKGYVLTAGDYYFAVGSDAHDAVNNVLAAQNFTAGLIDHEGTPVTVGANKTHKWTMALDTTTYKYGANGKEVTNQFAKMDLNYWAGNSVTYLTRSDWEATFPTAPVQAKLLGEEMETLLQGDYYTKPANAPSTSEYAQGKSNSWKGVNNHIPFVDMKDVPYSGKYTVDGVEKDADAQWEKFIDQFSLEELGKMTGNNFGNKPVGDPIHLPEKAVGDGCQGVGETCFPAEYVLPDGVYTKNQLWACLYTSLLTCTFNKELMENRGTLMANEALYLNQTLIATGGGNLHRTPFGGRQAEYYSEDANLSYLVSAIELPAMEKLGILGQIKHFTANDQETYRQGVSTFYNEQAFREGSLRGFEGAVRKGKVKAIMQAFNRQGVSYSSSCPELSVTVLREEWGFIGQVMTDASSGALSGYKSHYTASITAGTDVYCLDGEAKGGGEIVKAIKATDDGYLLSCLRGAVKNSIYALSRSAAVNKVSTVVLVTPVWQIMTYAVMSVTIIMAAAALVVFGISKYNQYKAKGE